MTDMGDDGPPADDADPSLLTRIQSKPTLLEKASFALRNTMTGKIVVLFWVVFIFQFIIYPLLVGPIYSGTPPDADIHSLWATIFTLQPGGEHYLWTYITSIFAHGGFPHLLINSIVLLSFGIVVEEDHTSREFFAFFIAGGVFASITQMLLVNLAEAELLLLTIGTGEQLLFLGGSGAIAAIIGAATVKNPKAEVYVLFLPFLNFTLLSVLIGFVVVSFLVMLAFGVGSFRLAHAAHIGGALFGIWYGAQIYGIWRVKVTLLEYKDWLI